MVDNLFRILIVDNDPDSQKHLQYLLGINKNVTHVDVTDNVETALYKIVAQNVHLLIINSDLPGNKASEFICLLKRRNVDIPAVWISSATENVIPAIRCGVHDFLIKPVDKKLLEEVTAKYFRLKKKSLSGRLVEMLDSVKQENKIKINTKQGYVLISPAEIVFCESEDGGISLHLASGKIKYSSVTLTQMEQIVKNRNFYRLGRSVLINLNYVRSVNKGTDSVLMKFGHNYSEINSSHKSIKALLENCFNYA